MLGLGLFCSLGSWQLSRRQQAAAEEDRWRERLALPAFDLAEPPDDADLRVGRVRGIPDWDAVRLVVGRWDRNRPGYGLVVPVAQEGDDPWIVVDLGWVPADGVEPVLAAERARAAPRTWEGLVRSTSEDASAAEGLPAEADGTRRYWRKVSPREMFPDRAVSALVLQEGVGLAEEEPSPDREPPIGGWPAQPHHRPHGEYAATWFGIAAALILFWVYGSLQESPPPPGVPLDRTRPTA